MLKFRISFYATIYLFSVVSQPFLLDVPQESSMMKSSTRKTECFFIIYWLKVDKRVGSNFRSSLFVLQPHGVAKAGHSNYLFIAFNDQFQHFIHYF